MVLTNDYNENTLLLRKYLLDNYMRYGEPYDGRGENYASYYGTSELGIFLDNEFFELFSDYLQSIIVNSTIEITAMHSIKALESNDLITIERRVFLLSREETYGRPHRNFMTEGKRLEYFSIPENRFAYDTRGVPRTWWLRTPSTGGIPNEPSIIQHDLGQYSTVGMLTIHGDTKLGVRPAFCIPGDTPIHQGELGGETVFLINEE